MHTLVSCHRLLDIVDLVEPDDRVQIVFTVAPDVFNAGVADHLRRLGALVIPWQQAIRERFDLALAASHGGLHQLHAPVMLVSHGAGRGKLVKPAAHGGRPVGEPSVYGLDAPRLIRDGRLVASALMLSHEYERDVLARQCPEALPAAEVAGDSCFDRLVGSLPERRRYRRALGLGDDQKLVLVSSTWGEGGLFGAVPELLPALMDQLPADRFRVALLLHPAVWGAHGRRQVGAWTRDCRAAGMIVADPTEDWRAYVVAADVLVGDQGSVTTYGAGAGLPVLRALPGYPDQTAAGSPQSLVLSTAARLDLRKAIRPQLVAARPLDHRRVAAAITSRPGRSGRLLSRTMYRLMGLPEPRRDDLAVADVVPAPRGLRIAS